MSATLFAPHPANAGTTLTPLPAGSSAPALSLPALAGEAPALPALAGEAPALPGLEGEAPAPFGRQPVLVHFFATWCAPCRGELAALDRLARRRGAGEPVILAIDIGEPAVRVRRFFAGQPPAFPVLLDEGREAMALWQVEILPSTYLVDPHGRIAHFAAGPVAWDDAAASRLLDALADGGPVAALRLPEAVPNPEDVLEPEDLPDPEASPAASPLPDPSPPPDSTSSGSEP